MKNTHAESGTSTDSFISDLRALVTEAEKILDESKDGDGEGIGATLHARFEAAQERFNDLYAGARKQLVAGGKYTDHAIRTNPYQALAIAAGVGLLVGLLVGRRGK